MSRRPRALVACLLAACAAGAVAQSGWRIEAGAGVQTLDNGSPDWREAELSLRHRDGGRFVELQARDARRYGLHDREIALGGGFALSPDWNLGLRVSAAPGADFLPRQGGSAELGLRLAGGWIAAAALGRNRYDGAETAPSGTSSLRLGLERYAGPWRWAGAITHNRTDGGATARGGRLQLDHFFGDEARLGLLAALGRELESEPQGLLSTRVRSVVLLGRWPLAPGWQLSGEISRTRVSDLERRLGGVSEAVPGGYRRDGVRLGVRREF